MRTIHSAHHHHGWDNAFDPVADVAPGDSLTVQCLDAAGGHYTQTSTADDIAGVDPARVNPVTGPIRVDGAKPGDCLAVRIETFMPSGFGWTAIIPGFGLLADQFTRPRLHLWNYDVSGAEPGLFGSFARVPLKPFAGTLGVAPAAAGHHDIIPPRHIGGNMDIRDLAAGTTLYLPVEVEGALFSIGDTHAAQGDGEICGTAIESAMDVTLTFDIIPDAAPSFPRFSTHGPVTRHLDGRGYEVATGVGPDLMQAARDAVSGMVDHISRREGIAPEDAYMLCSVCGDLRISEIVDAPNWVVSFYFPNVVFD
ncbi:MAG: acetamidase/formamidase family protein [Rhodobiaceae bacterium]|nr:acetamidase/formamidase family protein [Rhodobiaceae bacterium]